MSKINFSVPFLLVVIMTVCLMEAESQGISPQTKEGIDFVREEAYRKAIAVLEDALRENPKDAIAAEYLGVAYLYSAEGLDMTKNTSKAEKSMGKALELGGRAAFIVDHGLGDWRDKHNLKVERGNLFVYKDRLEFEGIRNATKFTIPADDIKKFGFSGRGQISNSYYIEAGKKKYEFRPAHFTKPEGEILFRLLETYSGLAGKASK